MSKYPKGIIRKITETIINNINNSLNIISDSSPAISLSFVRLFLVLLCLVRCVSVLGTTFLRKHFMLLRHTAKSC